MRNPAAISYVWISARAKNALRHPARLGIAGGIVFLSALIAFVTIPRQASRTARVVVGRIEDRPDSLSVLGVRDRAAAQIAVTDSVLSIARRTATQATTQAIDTFPPEVIARRDSLAAIVSALLRMISRAQTAPLPSSYRALGESPFLSDMPQVRILLDSLSELEKEREAFGAVGGVDPVYVALTARATAIGRGIQSVAEAKRAEVRAELAQLQPVQTIQIAQPTIDTAKYAANRMEAQRIWFGANQELVGIRKKNRDIDAQLERARELANVGAPPLAMLAAALTLALVIGFSAAFGAELKRPNIADVREAEQVTGLRVLTTVKPSESFERARRRADIEAHPLINLVSESYRSLYMHIAGSDEPVSIVTITGDDPAIVATIAANLAATAAYEARSTLLVDVDPTTSAISGILRVRSDPGLAGIIGGNTAWAEAIVVTTIGRDSSLDVLPSGTRRSGPPFAEIAQRIRSDFLRMERRYDFIVIAAPLSYVQRDETSIVPSADVIVCARLAHTRIADLQKHVGKLRDMQLTIHGLVLWDNELPIIEQVDDLPEKNSEEKRERLQLAGAQ